VNHLFAQIGASCGLDGFALDQHGLCALAHRGYEVVLRLTPDGRWLSQHAKLAPAPVDPAARLALFESLLALNHLGIETEGLVISLAPDCTVVVLHYNYPIDAVTDAAELRNLLNFFLSALDRIEDKLRDEPAAIEAPEASESDYMLRV